LSLSRRIKSKARDLVGDQIDSLQRALGRKDKTYAGEFQALSNILNSLGSPKNFSFIDVGAGDGFNMSIAFPLFKYFGAHGLLLEPNQSQLNKAASLYEKKAGFSFSSEFLTPKNSRNILESAGFLNPLYIKVDIDSFDLDVIRSILAHSIRPKIYSVEINELFPPPVMFEVRYREDVPEFRSPLRGCSLQSAYELAGEYGYFLHSLAFNNAFFVSKEYLETHFKNSQLDPTTAYLEGFLRQGWHTLFPWDIEFTNWIESSSDDLNKIIRGLPEFNESYMELA